MAMPVNHLIFSLAAAIPLLAPIALPAERVVVASKESARKLPIGTKVVTFTNCDLEAVNAVPEESLVSLVSVVISHCNSTVAGVVLDRIVAGNVKSLVMGGPNLRVGSEILSKVAQLTVLQELTLAGCPIDDVSNADDWPAWTGESIVIHECVGLSSETLRYLVSPSAIKKLRIRQSIDGGMVTDNEVRWISRKGELTELSIEFANITRNAIRDIGSMKSLRRLRLPQAPPQRSDNPLAELRNLQSLRELDLSMCRWAASAIRSGIPSVRTLNLSRVPGIDTGKLAEHWPDLEGLNLSECQMDGASVAKLAQLSKLRHLNLEGSGRLTSLGVAQLWKLPLESLSLRECAQLAEGSLSGMVGHKTLRHLDVGKCPALGRADFKAIASCIALESIELEGNPHLQDQDLLELAKIPTLNQLGIRLCGALTRSAVDAVVADYPALKLIHRP